MTEIPSTSAAAAGAMETATTSKDVCRTVLVIDGAYAHVGARKLEGGRIDYLKFRNVLECQIDTRLRECWFFDQEPIMQRSSQQSLSAQFNALKLAPPLGPQFQVSLYAMKKYACYCQRCGYKFHQMVQKGVDNGIATKILSLAYENICDRFILFAGDGDFYDSLNLVKNVLRKDLWVIGYRNTMSADLQQLASHVIWMDDIWHEVNMVVGQTGLRDNDVDARENSISTTSQRRGRTAERQVRVTMDNNYARTQSSQPVKPVQPHQQSNQTDRSTQVIQTNHLSHANPSNRRNNHGRPRDRSRHCNQSRPRQVPRQLTQDNSNDESDWIREEENVTNSVDGLDGPNAQEQRRSSGARGQKRKRNGIDLQSAGRQGDGLGIHGGDAYLHVPGLRKEQTATESTLFAMSDVSSSDEGVSTRKERRKEQIMVIDLASDTD